MFDWKTRLGNFIVFHLVCLIDSSNLLRSLEQPWEKHWAVVYYKWFHHDFKKFQTIIELLDGENGLRIASWALSLLILW